MGPEVSDNDLSMNLGQKRPKGGDDDILGDSPVPIISSKKKRNKNRKRNRKKKNNAANMADLNESKFQNMTLQEQIAIMKQHEKNQSAKREDSLSSSDLDIL